jgi:hypothetical protein
VLQAAQGRFVPGHLSHERGVLHHARDPHITDLSINRLFSHGTLLAVRAMSRVPSLAGDQWIIIASRAGGRCAAARPAPRRIAPRTKRVRSPSLRGGPPCLVPGTLDQPPSYRRSWVASRRIREFATHSNRATDAANRRSP